MTRILNLGPVPGPQAFDASCSHTLGVEGAYSDHPSDRGGRTMLGITERVARRWGYSGAMRDLPLATAVAIYRSLYWDSLELDRIAEDFSGAIAAELFDTGVNMGPGKAAEFLQQALNALNRQERDWADIAVDGDLGPATLRALGALKRKRGERGRAVLMKMLECLQGARYVRIAEGRPQNEDFVFGWFENRIGALG
ncbi:hypothetical protein B5C34_09525 [Pacificimonas flava]|uniref:Uncharacterized protein n=2 Tax=Pacificimonas TaxID=1960290 RepID=A0A219B8K1_9SPHN|nr:MULTISPECIES: glycosyl hydrolase 108 family protein [Pacificimonas]MBZ6379088.1 hypothetical protein [Pacificimonas aurantium]OWV34720.1 hypothetical protein B5C34_09525 [Pacificimonas flava]